MTYSRIIRVNFTFSLEGGLWVYRENGRSGWITWAALLSEVGHEEKERLANIAYANGMTGMWYDTETGRNSCVDGELAV